MDLRQFAQRMKVQGQTVVDNSDRLVRRVAVAVDAAVVLSTPVDTGRARSNWQTQVDGTPTGVVPAYAPGKEGSTSGPNAQAAIDQANAVIATYNGDRNDAITITNNLPYIGRLNDGWSAQAPAGFVEQAVHAAAASIGDSRVTVRGGV